MEGQDHGSSQWLRWMVQTKHCMRSLKQRKNLNSCINCLSMCVYMCILECVFANVYVLWMCMCAVRVWMYRYAVCVHVLQCYCTYTRWSRSIPTSNGIKSVTSTSSPLIPPVLQIKAFIASIGTNSSKAERLSHFRTITDDSITY